MSHHSSNRRPDFAETKKARTRRAERRAVIHAKSDWLNTYVCRPFTY